MDQSVCSIPALRGRGQKGQPITEQSFFLLEEKERKTKTHGDVHQLTTEAWARDTKTQEEKETLTHRHIHTHTHTQRPSNTVTLAETSTWYILPLYAANLSQLVHFELFCIYQDQCYHNKKHSQYLSTHKNLSLSFPSLPRFLPNDQTHMLALTPRLHLFESHSIGTRSYPHQSSSNTENFWREIRVGCWGVSLLLTDRHWSNRRWTPGDAHVVCRGAWN